jgi:peptidoglycan/LPS O-acetylase OafA/YrhL
MVPRAGADASSASGEALGRLQERLADRDNNFDVLRLAAAGMVLVGHSFGLAGHFESEPVLPLTDVGLSFAGVVIFFAISGFLVTRSWLNEPRALPFAVKRGLRILPGLVVVLALTAYVLGPLVTSRGASDYLSEGDPAAYVVGRSLMLNQRAVHGRLADRLTELPGGSLPGVFDENPLPDVNGPLWTLPIEVSAYALVALGGVLMVLSRRRTSTRIAAAVVLIGASGLVVRAGGTMVYEVGSLLAVFAGGSLLYILRSRLKLSVGFLAAAAGLWILSFQLPLVAQAALTGLALPYMVVFLAFRALNGLQWLTRPGDVSYGLYIYAWPVGQVVVHATGTRSPALVIALSGLATYILALTSWRLVERPALRLKRRLSHPSVRRTVVGSKPDLASSGAPSGR